MKVLILGKGYIGNYLAKKLEKTSIEVVHLSKNDLDYTIPFNFGYHIRSISFDLGNHLTINPYDWIINCSGYTGVPNVDACEDHKEECYKYNVRVPLNLTHAANNTGIPIIHIGSGCVYSGYDKEYTEDDIKNFGVNNPDSSFYSKTKDAFETFSEKLDRYIFRIRIPFNGVNEPKNYLNKLLKYDTLISYQNSITNVDDLMTFIESFILREKKPEYGIYNVVNKGSIEAKEVIEIMKENGLKNDKWNFVSTEGANFRVARSNCILSTDKIEKLGLGLPPVKESMKKAVSEFSKKILS